MFETCGKSSMFMDLFLCCRSVCGRGIVGDNEPRSFSILYRTGTYSLTTTHHYHSSPITITTIIDAKIIFYSLVLVIAWQLIQ